MHSEYCMVCVVYLWFLFERRKESNSNGKEEEAMLCAGLRGYFVWLPGVRAKRRSGSRSISFTHYSSFDSCSIIGRYL